MSNAIYSESLRNYIVYNRTVKRAASKNGLNGDWFPLRLKLDEMAKAAEAEVGRKVDVWDSIFSELLNR
jgi:hypothetical protein